MNTQDIINKVLFSIQGHYAEDQVLGELDDCGGLNEFDKEKQRLAFAVVIRDICQSAVTNPDGPDGFRNNPEAIQDRVNLERACFDMSPRAWIALARQVLENYQAAQDDEAVALETEEEIFELEELYRLPDASIGPMAQRPSGEYRRLEP